ncbi:MAG: hypothetical protein ACRDDL_06890 [Sarcina sp.]
MSIKMIFFLIVIFYILNKILDIIVKKTKKNKEKNKKKQMIPVMNVLATYSDEEFKEFILEYLEYDNYFVKEEFDKYLYTEKEGGEYLIYIKHSKQYSEKINLEDIGLIIDKMLNENIENAYIMTSGYIETEVNKLLANRKTNINILEGHDLSKKIREMKKLEYIKSMKEC